MKANEIVKKFGHKAIKDVIKNSDEIATHIKVYGGDTLLVDYIQWDGMRISVMQNDKWIKLSRVYQEVPDFVAIDTLKRLVESHELVERIISSHNKTFPECQIGLKELRVMAFGKGWKRFPKGLKQAIADVESCQ